MIKMYWHDLAIESHRTSKRVAELILALHEAGVEVRQELSTECDVAFLGGFERWRGFRAAVDRENDYRRGIARIPPIKTCVYVWDIYPAKMREDENWRQYATWVQYWTDLRLVPNVGTKRRVAEYTGTDCKIVEPAANHFDEVPVGWTPNRDDPYVVDVVRPYPWDERDGWAKAACEQVGVRYVRLDGSLPRGQFVGTVLGACCLVSSLKEASTGGLTLYEGYAAGVPVVIPANEPYHGAMELFHAYAGTNDHQLPGVDLFWTYQHLVVAIARASRFVTVEPDPETQATVREGSSDRAFAECLKERLSSLLQEPR